MKWFKIIDFWISILLLLLSILLIIFSFYNEKFQIKILRYDLLIISFIFGIWHSFSLTMHFIFYKKWILKKLRLTYSLLSILVIVYSNTITINNWYPYHIYILVLMSIFYISMCGYENFKAK